MLSLLVMPPPLLELLQLLLLELLLELLLLDGPACATANAFCSLAVCPSSLVSRPCRLDC